MNYAVRPLTPVPFEAPVETPQQRAHRLRAEAYEQLAAAERIEWELAAAREPVPTSNAPVIVGTDGAAFLTRKQAAAELQVSVSTVKTLERTGLLPVVSVGSTVRIPVSALRALPERGRDG